MDWVDKNITEIEDQIRTRISCTCEGLSDTYAWKETLSHNPLCMVESNPEEVADHIPYGSTNKIPCSSIDRVDRDTLETKTVGGKEFDFYYKLFVMNGIVLTCGKPQRLNLQPLDTFHTHAHEVNNDFFMHEDCANNFDENQALGLFQQKLELFSGKSLFPMGGSNEDEGWEAISWVDYYCRVVIQISTHISISASSSENEN